MTAKSPAPPGDRLELLETFVRIAETGGIGAAARVLDTSQPTVSRRLRQLEGLLEASLVDRNTQHLSLTSAGAALLPEARDVLARWGGLKALAGDDVAPPQGVVRIAVARDLATELLPDILAEFLVRYSEVRIETFVTDGAVDLAGDGVDFALQVGKGSTEGAMCREIATVRNGLYAAPALADRLAMERGLEIERCEPLALEDAPLIATFEAVAPGAMRFQDADGTTLEARFQLVALFDEVEPALRLALSGVGLGLAPSWRAEELVADGLLIPVAGDWAVDPAPVNLIWIANRFRSAAASTLLEFLQEELPRRLQTAAF